MNNIDLGRSKNHGFTLLEVLVALVILAVGMVGVIQVQSSFLSAARESELRALGYSVAESKIEELRNYQDKSEFTNITSNTIGSSPSVSISYGAVADPLEFSFEGSTVTSFDASGASVADNSPSLKYKEIELKVNSDYTDTITIATIIGLVDPALTGFANVAGDGAGGAKPDVDYNVGAQPDVIPIDLQDGTLKESTRPLPEVSSKGGSTEVSFQAVRYTPTGNGIGIEETLEDFVTVNCTCKYPDDPDDLIGSGLPPAYVDYDPSTQSLEVKYSNQFVSKAVASPYVPSGENDQSFLCTRCCRDHHDGGSDEAEQYRWYWPARTADNNDYWYNTSGPTEGDHEHFYNSAGDTTYERAIPYLSSGNKIYVENCRFRRVDGIYRLMQDWRLVDMTVMPSNYLVSGAVGVTAYQNYFVSAAESMLASAALASDGFGSVYPSGITKPSGRDYNAAGMGVLGLNDTLQLQVRSIYVDRLSSGAAQSILAIKDAGGSWLDKVPIYEVNSTLLSEWKTSLSSVASVENDPVKALEDPDNYLTFDGNYKKGLVGTVSSGTAYLTVSAAISNTGVVGHRTQLSKNDPTDFKYTWTDSIFDPLNTISDTIEVVVSSSAGSLTATLSGTLACWQYDTKTQAGVTTTSYSSCAASAIDKLTGSIQITANGVNCSHGQSGNSYIFTCSSVPVSASGYSLYFNDTRGASATLEFNQYTGSTSYLQASTANPYTGTVSSAGSGLEYLVLMPK